MFNFNHFDFSLGFVRIRASRPEDDSSHFWPVEGLQQRDEGPRQSAPEAVRIEYNCPIGT